MDPRVINGGGDEWCTPDKWIAAVAQVLGEIDLDPASNRDAAARIPAKRFYTKEDDGLSHPWAGRVWLNPPYSRSLMQRFIEKLLLHYKSGDVTEAIVLTHNNTDTAWWHELAATAAAVCFPRGRIAFLRKDGNRNRPTQGQTFFYLGKDKEAFLSVFGQFGCVMGNLD